MMTIVILGIVLLLAYWNGANDNIKGAATLFGSRTTNYRKALIWATVTTVAGGVTACFLARQLAVQFSGKGLVPDVWIQDPQFVIAAGAGAMATILLATLIGMPVSTTHSLIGGLTGAGLVAAGSALNPAILAALFLLPLLFSPVVSALLGFAGQRFFRWCRLRMGVGKSTCVCVGEEEVAVPGRAEPDMVLSVARKQGLRVDDTSACYERYSGKFYGVPVQKLLHMAHYLSAGMVCFARGLNDTPKILGLLLLFPLLSVEWTTLGIVAAMGMGGLLHARRVGHTMGYDITAMNHGQGFTANFTTALLTTAASLFALPVSTTHVSVSAIWGSGAAYGKLNMHSSRNILLAWVVTLPLAAGCSAVIFYGFAIF